MATRQRRSTVAQIMSVMRDTLAVAATVRLGNQPVARNLRGPGIDPAQFRQIARPDFRSPRLETQDAAVGRRANRRYLRRKVR